MSTFTPAAPKPYAYFNKLDRMLKRDFDTSPAGHSYVAVAGAPSLGGSPGGYLYFGHWTLPDGSSLYMRSNMDRSVSTSLFDPMGRQVEFFVSDTLIEAEGRIQSMDLI